MKEFWKGWLRCFARGLHALVAMMAAGLIVQVVIQAVVWLISRVLGEEWVRQSIFETVVPLAGFVLIGMPLFGFLFSNAYAPRGLRESAGREGEDGGTIERGAEERP